MGRSFSWCPYEESARARWFARFHGGFALLWTVLAVGRFATAGSTSSAWFLAVAAVGSMVSRLQVERPWFRIDDDGLTWCGLGLERSLPWERVEAVHLGKDGGSLVAVVDVDREVAGIPQEAQRDLDRSPERVAALREVLRHHATDHGFALRD